jgi:hypothetical protein
VEEALDCTEATPLAGEQPSNLAAMNENSESAGSERSSEAEALESLHQELAGSDPTIIIANHCYGLFELAAVYLAESPPKLASAQLAIDALSAVVERLDERLGEASEPLKDALAQLRMAWAQLSTISSSER